ncbi:rhodanese-like domain-containing protein [Streptococcus suis]|nr:rhodanese-like domain-containing protein [Streptococcus suis]NQJ69088.1 rhodanese-like domain-containing protein [Streptococcus suis]NQJ77332.1 rhodanese-like domain-containing protein [Streptococcus suis]
MGFNYWRLRRAATVIDNAEFAEKIHGGQLIDLRDPSEFSRKHILGARNIPYQQLKMSTNALRKDKPVLIYENDRGQLVTPAALYLKKQGFNEIYILSYGLNGWNGKVKKSK